MNVIRPAAEAALDAERTQLIAAARASVEALPAPDGTRPLAGKAKDMTVEMIDVDNGLVVLSDGDVPLVIRSDDVGHVRVGHKRDGAWGVASERVKDLAELGKALPDEVTA